MYVCVCVCLSVDKIVALELAPKLLNRFWWNFREKIRAWWWCFPTIQMVTEGQGHALTWSLNQVKTNISGTIKLIGLKLCRHIVFIRHSRSGAVERRREAAWRCEAALQKATIFWVVGWASSKSIAVMHKQSVFRSLTEWKSRCPIALT